MLLFETEPAQPQTDSAAGGAAGKSGGGALLPGDWRCLQCGCQVREREGGCERGREGERVMWPGGELGKGRERGERERGRERECGAKP